MTRNSAQAAARQGTQPQLPAIRADANTYQPATILFVDMIGFTAFCAENDPQTVRTVLQDLLRLLSEQVLACGGTIEKYLGDGLMARFDGSSFGSRDAANAVRCGVAMTEKVAQWNASSGRHGESAIRVAIGVHSGSVIIAPVGGSRHGELAVFGDTVNIASRLEGKCRCLDAAILITAQVAEKVVSEGRSDLLAGFAAFGFHELRGRSGYLHLHGLPRSSSDL